MMITVSGNDRSFSYNELKCLRYKYPILQMQNDGYDDPTDIPYPMTPNTLSLTSTVVRPSKLE